MKTKGLTRSFALLALCACSHAAPKAPAVPPPPAPPALGEVRLDPAEQVRPMLALRVTAAPLASIVADLDGFGRGLQLPLSLGQAAFEQLLQTPNMMLTRAQLDRLDPAQSMALVMLARDKNGICGALTFKSPELARKTVEEIVPAEKRTPGTFAWPQDQGTWIGLHGRTLLTADSQEALASLGALAIEAQRTPREGQLLFSVYPQNLARAQGVPLPALVEMAAAAMSAKLEQSAKEAKPAKGKKSERSDSPELTPAMNRMVIAFFKAAAQPIAESEVVHLAVKLGQQDGLRLRTEIVPLAGTASAGRTQKRPYVIDTKLPIHDDRSTVFAFGEAGTGVNALIGALAATGPAGKTMSERLGAVVNEVIAGGSCHVKSLAPLDNLCAFQLRPGVTPARALDVYSQAFKSSQAWNDEVMGKKKSRVTVRKAKDVIEIDVLAPNPDPRSKVMEKAMWGGELQKYAIAVRDGRLVQAQGAKPREILQRWEQPAKAGAAPILESVASRTRGAEVLVYIDLMSLVGAVGKASEDPSMKQVGAMMGAVPGLTELRAPLVLALWGGQTTAFDLQVPYQTLSNVAQVVRPFMGMMGGGAPPGAR